MKTLQILTIGLALLMSFQFAQAQRGTGQENGVAYSNADVETARLSGTITAIKTGPCENTTGRSSSGTHVFVKSSSGTTYNIHLGPTGAVSNIAGQLEKGKEIRVDAFRTDNHPKNNYVAREIDYGDKHFTLRDENLRPSWAGQGRGKRRGKGRRGGRW